MEHGTCNMYHKRKSLGVCYRLDFVPFPHPPQVTFLLSQLVLASQGVGRTRILDIKCEENLMFIRRWCHSLILSWNTDDQRKRNDKKK